MKLSIGAHGALVEFAKCHETDSPDFLQHWEELSSVGLICVKDSPKLFGRDCFNSASMTEAGYQYLRDCECS